MIEKIKELILSGDKTNKELAIQLIESQNLIVHTLRGILVSYQAKEVVFLDGQDEIQHHRDVHIAFDGILTRVEELVIIRTRKALPFKVCYELDLILNGKILLDQLEHKRHDQNITLDEREINELEFIKQIY